MPHGKLDVFRRSCDLYIFSFVHLPSLKLTYPLKIGRTPTGNFIFQPCIFRVYVSFREGKNNTMLAAGSAVSRGGI